MTVKTKSYEQRATETKAAADAALAAWRATSREYNILAGEIETDPDASYTGLRARFNAGEPGVSAIDLMLARFLFEDALPAKLNRQKYLANTLADKVLTMDLRLAECLAPAVADVLGGITAEVALEVPTSFNPAHAPRVYISPHGPAKRDPHSGVLSGQIRVHRLRALAHQTPELDVDALSTGLDDRGVRLPREARLRGTQDVGSGLLLDTAHVEVRFALPETFVFPAGHVPTELDARNFAESVAYRAAESASTVGPREWDGSSPGNGTLGGQVRAIGLREAKDVTMQVAPVDEHGTRLVTVRAELACTPRARHAVDSDATVASRVLRGEVDASVGTAVAALGHVVSARVVRQLGSFRAGDREGAAVVAEFVLESTVEGGEAQQAA